VAQTWELEQHHLRILQAAGEAWDQAQAARAAVAVDGLTVATADGGRKAHPLLTTATVARTQFASLVAALDLDAGTPGGSR
jgi:phage terminase small subunit